ncbi:tetratricopeptide repeat protein [Sphingomonas sp. PR090111-T3T-6A]|uniref:tetratricopeptide repeat protein n=1 Tax=Sphingomonas sp. PR090111-T3T-6A TaxID=685778 RepID=UPI00037B8928|nr:tetratricopeptide repeat protein [Sphingomonas sp. PR090111-T3T-6A]
MTDLETLNRMNADALRTALSGPPEELAPLLRTAAEGGAVEAQLLLGQMLLDGRGVSHRPEEALRWFGEAAKAGHPMGMNMVGRCLEHGWGTSVDKAKAAQWYEAAADRGLDWGLYNLATLLSLGEGVAQDLPRALGLFRDAAAKGHAKSMNMVGSFHEDGWVAPADRTMAARHYARAAEGGDFRGRFNHARMLIEDGRIEEALVWLRRVPETATPRFMAQMDQWLSQQSDPRLRELALDGR